MKLTSKEIVAIDDLYASAAGNGFDFGFTDDVTSLPEASRGGVINSLAKKGLIINYTDDVFNQFQFTPLFWEMIGTRADGDVDYHPESSSDARVAFGAWLARIKT